MSPGSNFSVREEGIYVDCAQFCDHSVGILYGSGSFVILERDEHREAEAVQIVRQPFRRELRGTRAEYGFHSLTFDDF